MKSNSKNIEELISQHKRLIELEASRHSRFVPESVVLAEAYKIASKAAHSYDPKSGNKFSTHLTNQLKKLSRISTQYGATIRLPENKQFKLQGLNQVEAILKDELDREPSVAELADATGMSIKEINYLKQHRTNEVNISNMAYTPTFINNDNDDWLHFVYHDLDPVDKVIFEYKTGFGGKQPLSNEELAKKLKMSPSTVNNRSKMIADKISEGWH
jgi:DNA-directed RNA polymerase specialized sigma subunit